MFDEIIRNFDENSRSAFKLASFDNEVTATVIDSLTTIKDKMTHETHKKDLGKIEQLITNIKNNNSSREHRKIINNQTLVLLVSYFSAAISEIYIIGFEAMEIVKPKDFFKGFKLTYDEYLSIKEKSVKVADVYVKSNNISFQDMKSLKENLGKLFGIEIEKDQDVENIIYSHASRHIIVHNGEKISQKFLFQIRDTRKNRLVHSQKNLNEDDKIIFKISDLEIIDQSMKNYLDKITKQIKDKHGI